MLMNRLGWTIFGVLVLLVAAIVCGFLFWPHAGAPSAPAAPGDTTETSDLTGRAIYANGEYGFTITYPETASTSDDFSTFYHLAPFYRANGAAEATGTPVFQIIGYATESDHSFPRYYDAMVRIGVSSDAAEVADCTKITPDTGEEALPDAVMNGTTWKVFSFQNAGMMQYLKGVSYRTVHEGKCFVMEKLATGSSYRDDPASADDVPQATLDKAYADLDQIVQSFAFTTP